MGKGKNYKDTIYFIHNSVLKQQLWYSMQWRGKTPG